MSIRALSWSLAAATLCLTAAGGAQAQIAIGGNAGNVSCNGGANGFATATPTGGTAPYTYSWAPSGQMGATAFGLSAGSHTVTVTDANNVSATRAYTITQPTFLNVTLGSQTNVSSPGSANGIATVSVSGGTPIYTYLWSPSGGLAATASGLAAGTYTVIVTDANACQGTQTFTITEPAAAPAATVASVGVPPSGVYMSGQPLIFTVNFSEAVTVDTSGGIPRIALSIGAVTRYAEYKAGSGTSSLNFQYILQPGDVDSDGITIGALDPNSGTIQNGSTNANLTLHSVGATTGVLVGAAPPAPVPTLTEWAMILLAGLLGLFGLSQVMQRRRTV